MLQKKNIHVVSIGKVLVTAVWAIKVEIANVHPKKVEVRKKIFSLRGKL